MPYAQPGMPPGMQPGMQPGMHPGMQSGMQPGMHPGMQQGVGGAPAAPLGPAADTPEARLLFAVGTLQQHLTGIQRHMQAMSQQCAKAEERIRTSQEMQNHFAREFREIIDMTRGGVAQEQP